MGKAGRGGTGKRIPTLVRRNDHASLDFTSPHTYPPGRLGFPCRKCLHFPHAARGGPPRVLLAPDAVRGVHRRRLCKRHLRSPQRTPRQSRSRLRDLRRGDGHFTFDLGKLAFFASYKGQVTGVVFSGRGHVVAAPRDPVEKQQMARFLGAPVLDEAFSDVYLRFTDDTAAELLRELSSAGVQPVQDTEFAVRWDPIAAQVNPGQSLRLLFDIVSAHPEPYFYAAVEGNTTGPFDMMIDPQRSEGALLGQPKRNGTIDYYDVWASYPLPGQSPARRRFSALDY